MNIIRKYLPTIFWMVIFVALFWYFAFIHPLYVYDMDDWTYIVPTRKAIPIWKNWNPTRVLPETLMPLIAELGYRLFYPFSGDFIESMAMGFALAVSLFYTAYFWFFNRLVVKKEDFRLHEKIAMGAFLILLHFLPYMTSPYANSFMYLAGNVTTIFYYTIPALLNGILVLYFSSSDNWKSFNFKEISHNPAWRHGILILMIYLAINSNMFQSVIFMAFISGMLFFDFLIRLYGHKCTVKRYIISFVKEHTIWFAVIVIWLVALFMESQGGRATSMQYEGNYLDLVGEAFVAWWKTLLSLNSFFLAATVLIIVGATFVCILNRKRGENRDKEYFHKAAVYMISFLITSLYLILLCARTGVGYLLGSGVFSAILFYLFLLIGISLVYVIKNMRLLINLMPLAVYILLFATIINVRSYREINCNNFDAEVVKQISDDVVNSVVTAYRGGSETAEVHVPVYASNDNWPLSPGLSERVARALYSYGITSSNMEVILIPDEEKNEFFHLE